MLVLVLVRLVLGWFALLLLLQLVLVLVLLLVLVLMATILLMSRLSHTPEPGVDVIAAAKLCVFSPRHAAYVCKPCHSVCKCPNVRPLPSTLPAPPGPLLCSHLALSMNNLAHLPDALGKLSTLKQLEVSDNRLSHLPPALGEYMMSGMGLMVQQW